MSAALLVHGSARVNDDGWANCGNSGELPRGAILRTTIVAPPWTVITLDGSIGPATQNLPVAMPSPEDSPLEKNSKVPPLMVVWPE